MPMEPFLVNPPIRRGRHLLAFGLNPRRRKKTRRALSSKGLISLYTVKTADQIARAKADPTKVVKRKPSGSYQVYVRREANPLTRVHFPAHTETLMRKKVSGKWGRKKARKNPRKGVTPPWLKKFLFKKGHGKRKRVLSRRTPAKGASPMRHRRKHRRNPVVLGNPRRKHRRSARRNPVVLGNPHRRRHYSRNPKFISKLGLPPMKEVLFLGLGAYAGRIAIPQILARVAFLNSNPIIRGISRLGMVLAIGALSKPVLKQNAKMFTYGLLANQLPESVNDFLSLTGMKLADGNAELEMYTMPAIPAPAGGLGLYTLSDGEESTI